MSRQDRYRGEDITEVYASVLRQSGMRAIERLKQRRGSATPMDFLVLLYATFYLNTSTLPRASYLHQARRMVTESPVRVTHFQFFQLVSPHILVESLVAETSSDAMQKTMGEVQEFIEAREVVGDWISNGHLDGDDDSSGSDGSGDDEDKSAGETKLRKISWAQDSEGNPTEPTRAKRARNGELEGAKKGSSRSVTTAAAAVVWRSGRFWVLCAAYVDGLALLAAKSMLFSLKPEYEKELVAALEQLTSTKYQQRKAGVGSGVEKQGTVDEAKGAIDAEETAAGAAGGSLSAVKHEPDEADDDPSARIIPATTVTKRFQEGSLLWEEDVVGSGCGQEAAVEWDDATEIFFTEVTTDLLALANCPPNTDAHIGNAAFYEMAHSRVNIILARKRLIDFAKETVVAAPPLTPEQAMLKIQLEREMQLRNSRRGVSSGLSFPGEEAGAPLDFVPNAAYVASLMEKHDTFLGEDEDVFKDEIADYYKTRGPRRPNLNAVAAPPPLIKPHRFAKAKEGYTWSQYNRTHYDSRTNPPPNRILWYEFTLFYPALVATKKDMSRIYRIEDTGDDTNDEYCLLVFSVGPPYADVAYRIPRRQWDPRPGGVRASFDSEGKYRLFFRFSNSNYRR